MDNRVVFLTAKQLNGQAYAKPRVISVLENTISEAIPSQNSFLTRVKSKASLASPYPGNDALVFESPLEIEAARNPATTDLYVKNVIAAALIAAGTTQGAALALTRYLNEITTNDVGTNDGVKLPAATVGKVVVVINTNSAGAVPGVLKVYPATGEFIDANLVNVNVTVPLRGRKTFACPTTAGKWVTADDFTQG